MNGSFFNFSSSIIISIVILTLFICIFFIPLSSSYPEAFGIYNSNCIDSSIDINNSNFTWPIPGYTKITSPFGKRTSPTAGATSFHKGVDIGAPEGTNLFAITDGIITFTDFLGGGGYTITLTSQDMKVTYCHVSPDFIVKTGDNIFRGTHIGNVGPKYVYDVPNNPYKDSTGKPTNGAITGCHLHLGIRTNDNDYINPLDLFK